MSFLFKYQFNIIWKFKSPVEIATNNSIYYQKRLKKKNQQKTPNKSSNEKRQLVTFHVFESEHYVQRRKIKCNVLGCDLMPLNSEKI